MLIPGRMSEFGEGGGEISTKEGAEIAKEADGGGQRTKNLERP